MRWESLFADLEAAAEGADQLAFEAELVDQVRAERATIALADRVRAHAGGALTLHVIDGERAEGVVADSGVDWVLLRPAVGGSSARTLVPFAAVCAVEGLTRRAMPPGGVVAGRLGLSVVLRALATDRCGVRIRLRSGVMLGGTIDRVGADHLDLALHRDDEPRRAGAVSGVRTVPLAAIVLLHSS